LNFEQPVVSLFQPKHGSGGVKHRKRGAFSRRILSRPGPFLLTHPPITAAPC